MNRSAPVGIVALVFLVSVASVSGPIVLATDGPADPSAPEPAAVEPRAEQVTDAAGTSPFVSQETQRFDNRTFEITIHENGSATWTFRYERQFANEDNETEAKANFRAFKEEFEANETGLYDRFINQSRLLVEAGSQETGREMEATDFDRSARIDGWPNERGVVEMSFLWDGFANVTDETIVAGDVFQDIYLAADQAIVFEAGGDLTFRTIEPEGEYAGSSLEDADSVQWNGQQEFVDGRPRAVLERPDSAAVGSGDTGGVGPTDTADTTRYLAGAALLTGLGIAAVIWYRRYGPGADDTAVRGVTDSAAPSAQPAAGADSDGEPGTVAETADSSDGATAVADEELMSDEDRVVALIQENGGRMKQVNIVDATGWSKSKVSMLLSEMEDDGTISKLRVGRENIISLEGFEPEATKSPFDE
ncbi:DUF7343 domain-containing protein [Natrinema longum]|uniref:IclR helix-turn-helix domain-containing protein n=1 Tax=Natrinema longum TaxID=370324 RepID=A0A8A2U7A5_9EURY|nr:hypothetical protein [Natrinema longum]MBZ6493966.1 hypothetical protein [Natrinema longum]QSW84699.1 hypothetical protein J0X27_14775 [Natrinema longum]